jgi:putative membrane-bound dehydrogenase-like protein
MNYPLCTLLLACTLATNNAIAADPKADAGKRNPGDALSGLNVGDGLQAELFAAEPMLLSPSNIDVDHRGRIWVCEVVNYRKFANKNNPFREKGDRILILEDYDQDGKIDKQSVFYQGRDIDSAHGVCVLGNKVLVSALDKVLILTDTDGDDKADTKEVLFSGISGSQHDHGIHSFSFGPDGRLYFNFGNAGKQVKDKDGKPIVDKAGNVVSANRQPYQEGMVFRCNIDGSGFETIGWNFRNNWEVAVDSFGTVWQSDNDDDGNRGVRINFVMEFGNYGYKDELTGAGWRAPRTGMHQEIPLRHWHLRDPGVVPNLLQTGAGSPTGIMIYEGNLLPKQFHNQIIHCDAGPNIVRSYPVKNDGAGYKATTINILDGTRDKWFRPSDVCVAPDGSLIVADWYDPGVGGHRMGDIQRGRLFRITPKGHKGYVMPRYDFDTVAGAIKALQSPNLSARYLAWTALHEMQSEAEPALAKLYSNSDNPRFRARALWLLGQIKGRGEHYVGAALKDKNPNIRIAGLRLARLLNHNLAPLVTQLVGDPSAHVRRECVIALREINADVATPLWVEFATHHQAGDRWSLEALGIAARGRWNACLTAWLGEVGDNWNDAAGREIVWRSRAKQSPSLLAKLLADDKVPATELPRDLRAFDFLTGPEKDAALVKLAFAANSSNNERQTLVSTQAISRLQGFDVNQNPQHKAALNRIVDGQRGTGQFVTLVAQFNLKERYPELLVMAQAHPTEQIGIEAIRTLLSKQQRALIIGGLSHKDPQRAAATAQALGYSANGGIVGILSPLLDDAERPLQLRRQAVLSMAKIRGGALQIIKRVQAGKLAKPLRPAAAAALHSSNFNDVKQQALKLFPLPPSKNNKPLPSLAQLVKMKGDVKNGRVIFNTTATCAKCHVVNDFGKEVGPNLSEIGSKLSRQAFYDSILFPSAGISHNFETYTLVLESGNVVNGILTSRTPQSVTIKDIESISRTFKTSEIELMKKENTSLMPADIQKLMTAKELVDVVEYMSTLKKKAGKK